MSGEVRIDGTDIRQYQLKSLRDQISFVLQDTLLFRATIWENIAYGKPDFAPVARTANDLSRYHGKYILIDRRVLYVLSFNFTHLDVDHSRGFGIVTTHAHWVRDAARLFRADSTRTKFAPKTETFVVSPANSRKVLAAFLKRAKTQLLIYDPRISDKDMRRILHEQADAGIEIKVIGAVTGRTRFDVRKLAGARLHARTIIRDRRQAFIGSQSLRGPELDSRRELGLIVQDGKAVKMLIDTFDVDWAGTKARKGRARSKPPAASDTDVEKAVRVFTKELDPLALSVKKAVRQAVAKAGEDVLGDKDVKETMKKVVKKAVKEAVKKAVEDAQKAQ